MGVALIPALDLVASTADGFTVTVSNYNEAFAWAVSVSTGNAIINSSGLITVSDLAPSESATVTVTTSLMGYESGSSEISGSANIGLGLIPEFGAVISSADGFTVQVINYDSGFGWDLTPTAGNATISSSGLISIAGPTSGQNSVVTIRRRVCLQVLVPTSVAQQTTPVQA